MTEEDDGIMEELYEDTDVTEEVKKTDDGAKPTPPVPRREDAPPVPPVRQTEAPPKGGKALPTPPPDQQNGIMDEIYDEATSGQLRLVIFERTGMNCITLYLFLVQAKSACGIIGVFYYVS